MDRKIRTVTDVELTVIVNNTNTEPMEREPIGIMIEDILNAALKSKNMTVDVEVTGGGTLFCPTPEQLEWMALDRQGKLKRRVDEADPKIHPVIADFVINEKISFYTAEKLAKEISFDEQPRYAKDMLYLNRWAFNQSLKKKQPMF